MQPTPVELRRLDRHLPTGRRLQARTPRDHELGTVQVVGASAADSPAAVASILAAQRHVDSPGRVGPRVVAVMIAVEHQRRRSSRELVREQPHGRTLALYDDSHRWEACRCESGQVGRRIGVDRALSDALRETG